MGPRLDERIHNVCNPLLTDWADSRVTCRQSDEACVEMQRSNLSYLEETVIDR
jgi:hypothetical protein